MGFSPNNQQRISLSQRANAVIENDYYMFESSNKKSQTLAYHAFINRIFCNRYQYSDASIQIRVDEKREDLQKIQGNLNSKELRQFTEKILNSYKENLIIKIKELLNTKPERSNVISLNKKTLKILSISEEYKNEIYQEKHVSKYIRAVIEEYATLPPIEREKIYYQETIQKLEEYCQNGSTIKISLSKKKERIKIKPAFICSDKYDTHMYLAAILYQKDQKEHFASYRIDRIELLESTPGTLISPTTLTALKKEINHIGIQYLSGKSQQIRIKLSPAGIQKYKQLTFQRPMYSRIEGENQDIYIFDIPDYQVIVYFFKFGKDAIVLEPKKLKDYFLKKYKDAFYTYKSL